MLQTLRDLQSEQQAQACALKHPGVTDLLRRSDDSLKISGTTKRILLVSHAQDNRDAGSSRVVHLISEAISSDTIKVDMQHNKMNPGDLKAKTLGRLMMPRLVSNLVDNAGTYDVVVGFN